MGWVCDGSQHCIVYKAGMVIKRKQRTISTNLLHVALLINVKSRSCHSFDHIHTVLICRTLSVSEQFKTIEVNHMHSR